MDERYQERQKNIQLTIFVRIGNLYTSTASSLREEITKELIRNLERSSDEIWDSIYSQFIGHNLIAIKTRSDVTIKSFLLDVCRLLKKRQSYELSIEMLFSGDDLWNEDLPEGGTLGEAGVQDGDFILVTLTYDDRARLDLIPVPDASTLFKNICQDVNSFTKSNRSDSPLMGVLLYTDEDKVITTYVRNHFLDLHYMSSESLRIYVIEEPNWRLALQYWQGILNKKQLVTWGLLHLLDRKPCNKSQAYKVGDEIGIYPDQLPCHVLFDKIGSQEKLIFPIDTVSPNFRQLFSIIKKNLSDTGSGRSYENIKENYASILKSLKEAKCVSSTSESSTYVFHGQTVFINHPQGTVNLSGFQNR